MKIYKYIIPTRKRFLLLILFFLGLEFLTTFTYINLIGFNLYSKESIFKKGNKTIILLGMSHIGLSNYYNNIKTRYKKKEILILTEGVNIDVPGSSIDHSNSAKIFGLKTQPKKLFINNNYLNSDVKYSEIDPVISNYLSLSFEIWDNIANLEFQKARNLIKIISKESISLNQFYNELIIKRNKKIKYNIINNNFNTLVIPWGAIHLTDLESFIKKKGYKQIKTNRIKILNVPSILIHSIRYFTN